MLKQPLVMLVKEWERRLGLDKDNGSERCLHAVGVGEDRQTETHQELQRTKLKENARLPDEKPIEDDLACANRLRYVCTMCTWRSISSGVTIDTDTHTDTDIQPDSAF